MRPIKFTLSIICIFLCANVVQAQGKSSAVKIYGLLDKIERSRVIGLLHIDHFQMTPDSALLVEIGERELAKLRTTNYRFDIVVDDISANLEALNRQYYIDRANGDLPEQHRLAFEQPGSTLNNIITTPAAFQVKATFGGYYQFSEMNTAMNNLIAAYPAIAQKVSLGKSTENRDIWCIKISDNVATDETNEPEVLFTGLTHAREAIGGSSMIFLMQYLCENYATDTRIRDLVNNREIFIIPCTNPDGWQYNYTLNINGGGLWRKNRRVNGGGEFGVDLNRNWSVDWANCSAPIIGNPASCGSNVTSNDTYWGPSSFSEPETRAIRDFTYTRNFVTMIDQHSYGPYYSLPFGRPSLPTNVMDPLDQKFYNYVSAAMGNYNGMRAGNTPEALNYESAGTIKDWMLKGNIGTGTKGKVLGMTSEGATGTTGGATFWPPASQIINLCKGLVYQDIQLLHAAGTYINLQDKSDINLTSTTGTFDFNAIRVGIDNQPANISVIPLQNIQSVGSTLTINSLTNYYDSYNGSINYTLPASITNGQKVKFAWKIETGGITYYDTITKFYNATQMLYDNMDGSYATNWTGTNGWDFTSAGTGYGGGSSKAMSESPAGLYTASSTRRSAYNNPLDLTNATDAYISFWVKHRAENFRDKLQLQVSTNSTDGVNGTWTAIKGTTTVQEPGILDGSTINGIPALTGIKEDWTRELYDLNAYLGTPALRFRFEFTSDANTSGFDYQVDDGFYIDNLKVVKSTACPMITVTNPAITTGTAGTAFSQTFTASGGLAPYTFTTVSSLPTGLTLSSAGVLNGTPTQTGTFPIVVRATDANACFGNGTTYSLVIGCPTITVTNPATSTGTAGTAFSQTFTRTGGIGAVTFSTVSTLPTGLTLSAAGVLSGTPTQTGTFSIVVTATDANSCFGNGTTYSLVIGCPTITVTNPATTTGTAGTAFSQTFTRTGGIGAVTFTTVSTLPTGLTLSAAGVLSGTPTQTGTFSIVVTATDANACFGNGATYSLVIGCPTITVTNPATTTGTAGTAFSQTFTRTGGIGSVTFSTASTLPTGLTLSAAGVLSGTPTQTGTFPIVVVATDVNSCFGNGTTYNLVIGCPTITVTNPATTTGTAGTAFSQTFTRTGGIGSVTFSTASTLPTGLTLSAAGVLSGTPTQTGTFSIVVTATDANACFGNGATYSLVIGCPTITVTNPATTTGTAGTAFSQSFTRTGGIGAITFTTASTLPTGLTLSAAGILSGTPTQTGTFSIVVRATDANACFGNGSTYSLVINPAGCPTITVTNPATTTGTAGTAFNQTFSASGGAAPYTYTTTSSLPTGLTLSAAGVLSGTTTQHGTFPIVVKATDGNSCFGNGTTYNLVIVTPDLTASQFFNTTQIAAGGTIDEVIAIRNVGTIATSATSVFSVTTYSALTGLTVTLNPNPSVTIGFTSYPLSNANWTFNAGTGTFTSNPGIFITAGSTVYIGVRITRGVSPNQGANGSVSQTLTITNGTGGETPTNNNTINNSVLKN